jgi:membrane-associated phospholipid phosphatase
MCISMIVTITIYPFATAIGPIGYYGLGPPGDWSPTIEALRDHGIRVIKPKMLVGMVSLPSFHAAVGALMIWATWPVRISRWPFLLLNLAMIFTTIPFGEHYLIDVIGGILVAAFAAVISRSIYAQPTRDARRPAECPPGSPKFEIEGQLHQT